MSLLPDSFLPSHMAHRLGVFDALPNALSRSTGAMRLMRAALAREPAPVAPTPASLVAQEGCARLLRYARAAPPAFARPVLLCPSLINRPYILDLMRGNSLVEALVERGHDVYIIDWGDPGDAELDVDFAGFVRGRLRRFIDRTNVEAGSDQLHLVGQCLGGTMATALMAVDDHGVATLTNLTAPLDFHDGGMLSAWTKAPFFDPRALADALGHVPHWLSQPSFMVLRPMGTPVKALRLFQKLGDERFVDFFRALETWINDNVAIPRLFYLDLIERLYRENALVEGTLMLGDRPVVLEEVRVPTLTICAEQDHIVPPQSAVRGHERLGSEEKELEVFAGGHIGVVIGSKGRRELWPRMMAWFERHEGEEAAA